MALIVIVLLFDIGLAAAGGVLLAKGLASRADNNNKASTTSEPAPVEKRTQLEAPAAANVTAAIQPTAPAPVVAPPTNAPPIAAARAAGTRDPKPDATVKPIVTATTTAKPSANVTAAKPNASAKPDPTAKPADKPVATAKPDDKPVTKPDDKPVTKPDTAKPVNGVPTEPQDPYAAPNTEREIDAAAAHSKPAFDRCATGDVHGSVKIAFQVRYDGRVVNAAAVENATGNAELARCLVAEISSWKVSAHNGTTINMMRPFTYP